MRILLLGLASVLALGFIACSGDDDDGTATPAADVCAQKDSLQAAVSDLADLNILASGTDAMHQSVDKVKTESAALKNVASADVADEIDALDTAVTEAEDALSTLDNGATVNEKIDQLQTAFTGVVTAASSLGNALQKDCG